MPHRCARGQPALPAAGPRCRVRTGGGPGDGQLARQGLLLDVHFINTLPVLVPSCHSRKSGNPGDEGHGNWMPAYAGMTFY